MKNMKKWLLMVMITLKGKSYRLRERGTGPEPKRHPAPTAL